jgi:hypothetical protein
MNVEGLGCLVYPDDGLEKRRSIQPVPYRHQGAARAVAAGDYRRDNEARFILYVTIGQSGRRILLIRTVEDGPGPACV